MKRAIAAIASTVAGLVLLLGFKTGSPPAASTPAAPGTPAGPGAAPAPGSGAHTVTGLAVPNPFGSVQVRVTADGRHILNVSAVQLPGHTSYSAFLSASAGPLLRREALAAQSARIDVVSGATYTSDGYAQSLQSALDRLHA
jgi:uncharacterized protein with FMN-binding domain